MKLLAGGSIIKRYEFYLAGGTGLALQLGHRLSDDLDFFTEKPFYPQELAQTLGEKVPTHVVGLAPDTLHALMEKKVRASFFRYPHPLVFLMQKIFQ